MEKETVYYLIWQIALRGWKEDETVSLWFKINDILHERLDKESAEYIYRVLRDYLRMEKRVKELEEKIKALELEKNS